MKVTVPAQRGIQLVPAVHERAARLLLQGHQVCREVTSQGLGDDAAGGLADAGQLLKGPGVGPLAQLRGVEGLERLGGVAERLHPIRSGAGPLEQEADPAQCLHGVDRSLERLEEGDHQRPIWRRTRASHTRSPPTVLVVTIARAAGVSRYRVRGLSASTARTITFATLSDDVATRWLP